MAPYWKKLIYSNILLLSLLSGSAFASVNYTVNLSTDSATTTGGSGSGNSGDFRYVLNQILNGQAQGTSGPFNITFSTPSLQLQALPPPINLFTSDVITIGNSSSSSTVTIDGNGNRPFFIRQGNVTLQNLIIENANARGGSAASSNGAGGGLGAGGAIFVDAADVTISNVSFASNSATSGRGASSGSGGGGGGLGGAGGSGFGGGGGGYSGAGGAGAGYSGGGGSIANGGAGAAISGGGGGGAIIGAIGGAGPSGSGGSVANPNGSNYVFGGGGAATISGQGSGGGVNPGISSSKIGGGGGYQGSSSAGGTGGGGGAAYSVSAGNGGTGGGGGGYVGVNASSEFVGGAGGYLGGSGGMGGNPSFFTQNNSGGFGGGGGGSSGGAHTIAGAGGFGGGGGSASNSSALAGAGGFGAGGGGGVNWSTGGVGGSVILGANQGGGDGAAFGGGIFVNTGTVTIQGTSSTTGNSVSANSGSGAAAGTDLFIISGATLNFTPGIGSLITLSGTIADDSSNSVPNSGTWYPGTGSGAELIMDGPGILALQGANTYMGGTSVNSGLLIVSNSSSLGGGAVTIASGSELNVQGGITLSNNMTLSGPGLSSSGALLNVSDNNALNGAITLSDDTCIGSTAGLLTLGSGGIIGTYNLTFAGTGNTSVSGVIGTSTGTLTKNGSGTLTLSGTNTYSGATSISSGILNIQNTSALGNSSATVTTGAQLQAQGNIAPTNTLTLSGTGDGSGALLNVSDSNTFSGPITLLADTTIGSTSGLLTLGSGGITGTQNLTFAGAGNTTVSGVIGINTGTLTKNGSGTLTLSAANTFNGGTIINDTGTLALSGSGVLLSTAPVSLNGSSIFDIQNITPSSSTIGDLSATLGTTIKLGNKTLVFGSTNDTTISAVFTGTGGILSKEGSGIVTLSVANSYTGGTFINEGGLIISNNSSLGSGPVTSANGTTLAFKNGISFSNDITFTSGNILWQVDDTDLATVSSSTSGPGAFTKTGTGFLNYIGTGTQTGTNIVAEGTLFFNGSTKSLILVNHGATLRGSGTAGSVQNSGIFNPGNSCGNFTVTGNFEFLSGSDFIVYVDNSCHSSLTAEGNVVIQPGSALQILATPDYRKMQNSFTFVTASTIHGEFDTVTSNTPLIKPIVYYSNSSLSVGFSLIPLTSVVGNNNNAKAVAQALVNLIDNGSSQGELILNDLIEISQLQGVEAALNEMQPAIYKGFAISQENNIVKVQDTLHYRFQQNSNDCFCHPIEASTTEIANVCKEEKKPLNLWMDGFSDMLKQNSTCFSGSPQLGYQSKTGGVLLGFDGNLSEYFYVGTLGAFTDSSIDWNGTQSKGTIQTGYAGLYLSAIGNKFYGNLSIIGGWSHYKGHRNLNFPGVNVTAKNTHRGSQLLSHIDTGINLDYKGFTVNPFDSFDYITQTEGSFTETGAGVYNLHVKKTNAIMLRNELGVEFTRCLFFDSSRWMISPKVSWVREVRIKGQNYRSEFAGTDVMFKSTGYFPNRSLVSLGASIRGVMWDDRLALDLYYNGNFRHSYFDHNFGAQICFGF